MAELPGGKIAIAPISSLSLSIGTAIRSPRACEVNERRRREDRDRYRPARGQHSGMCCTSASCCEAGKGNVRDDRQGQARVRSTMRSIKARGTFCERTTRKHLPHTETWCQTWPRRCALRSREWSRRRERDHPTSWLDDIAALRRLRSAAQANSRELVEQAGVLDRDNGLIGKSRHQLNLFRGEWLRCCLRHKDHPDDISVAQEGGAKRSAIAADLLCPGPAISGSASTSGT